MFNNTIKNAEAAFSKQILAFLFKVLIIARSLKKEDIMKRIFCLILVFVSLFAFVSCSSKKKKEETLKIEEEISQEISAEKGGKIENSDKSISIEVPGEALESDTKITMKIYDAKGYPGTEGKDFISKVVEFEPSGTIFKKPVIISMKSLKDVENKIITAAVYRDEKGEWSYSEHGAYVVLNRNESGDPIMTSAAGDPIMLNAGGDPIMMSADGDPIMFSAAGDPIMLAAAGDPIMTNAAGDPIMNAAAGDPIMMTTGHFTAFTFIALEPKEPIEEPDGNNGEISDKDIIDEPVIKDDDENDTDISEDDEPVNDEDEIPDETADEDETIIIDEDENPDVDEDGNTYVAECGNSIVDPGEGCDNGTDNGQTACDYGETSCTLCTESCQIAEGATSYCGDGVVDSENGEKCDKAVSGSNCSDDCKKMYSKVLCTGMAICTDGEGHQILCPKEGEDFYGQDAQYVARKGCVKHRDYTEIDKPEGVEEPPFVKDNVTGLIWLAIDRSGTLEEMENECSFSFAGIDNWRVPTPQELLTLADLGQLRGNPVNQFFAAIYFNDYDSILTSSEDYIYLPSSGMFNSNVVPDSGYLYCVSGEEYGKVDESSYKTFTKNGDTAVFDSSTNLVWKKDSVIKTSWKDALEYCENLEYAGSDDWRLPNKNELVSLLDYSKTLGEVEVMSSFPDIVTDADAFWTSSPGRIGDYVWIVSMTDGIVRQLPAQEEYSLAALCVRIDLDEKPEIPECDETGIGPCRDASGTIWSSVLYPSIFAGYPQFWGGETVYETGISEMCRYLNENDTNKWRLPTIDEIRNIFTTEHLKTDGTCGVTDSCYQESCYNDNSCAYEGWSRTLLYDFGMIVSGTLADPFYYKHELWAVNSIEGRIEKNTEFSESDLVQRCVLDESLNYEKTPYLDENGLLWSDLSPDWMYLQDALYYCSELSQTDSEHWWRLPTMDELQTLVRIVDCLEENDCPTDLSGKYSVFGDISPLLSGEYEGDESYYFIDFSELFFSAGKEGIDRVRCVSDSPSPCAGDPCSGVEHSTGCIALSANEYECGCEEGYLQDASHNCVDPCAGNPCASLDNSTGECIRVSSDEYECECKPNYTWNDSVCKPDTKENVQCGGLPENAHWTSASVVSLQTWSGEDWLPSATAFWSEETTSEPCSFKCDDTFFWNNSACVTPLPLGEICTGQNKCYQNTGSGTVACPAEKDDDFYGQDWYYASLGKCAPHSFTIRTISGDNVVYDNNTGLQWQWQQSTPEGNFDWYAADEYCKQPYAGYDDWRLPTPMEVFSIGDGSRYQPAVDRTYFPSTNNHDSNNSRYWWTSKKSKAEPTKAYYVQYYVSTESHVKEMTESERLTAICVRGDGMPASSLSTSTLNGNVVVTDSTNGLMWQKTVSGDTFFWQDALGHCKNLTYAGYSDWRLPNKNELQTLLNHDKTGAPYSDFPDISTTKAYWTSTTWASSPNIAWVVDFGKARVFTMLKTNENYTYYAICVR